MTTRHPPGDGKLFVVPRVSTPAPPPPPTPRRTLRLNDHALIPLSAIFVAVVGFAGYACLYGDWPRAKDFLLVFLPAITALMGAASAGRPRS
ncbi:MAG: hypothetical protein ACLGXA_24975 [Acidobacteriota bacterium]